MARENIPAIVSPMLILILLAGGVFGPWSFEDTPTGRTPDGFEVVTTEPPPSQWVVEQRGCERVLAQTRATAEDKKGRHSFALLEDGAPRDVVLRVRVKLLTGNGQAGVVFRYQDPDNYYLLALDASRRKIRLVRAHDGNRVAIHGEDDVDLETGVWYRLTVRLSGPGIAARMYGLRLFDASDRSLPESGRIGLFCDDNTRADFAELSVAPIEP